jgi:hypothetical protein
MRVRRRTIAIGAVALILVIAPNWGGRVLFLFLWFGVLPIILFFQQDYRPWEDSIGDMAKIYLDTDAVSDTKALSRMAMATQTNHDTCAAFVAGLQNQSVFSVDAQIYCKVRIRTECACTGRGFAGPGKWLKVYITRGRNKGADVWMCGSAVGPSVTPL